MSPIELAKAHGFKLIFANGNDVELVSLYRAASLRIMVPLKDCNDDAEVCGAIRGVVAAMAALSDA